MIYIYLFFFNLLISNSSLSNYPKISIIIPIFYHNKSLNKNLNKVIKQTLKDIEIIFINDGLNKFNLKIIMQFIIDNRIIILNNLNKKNENYIIQGVEFASGKYIGIIDSNDFIKNNIFENLYKLTENEEFDIIRFKKFISYNKKQDKFKIINFLYNKIFNCNKLKFNFTTHPFIWREIYKKQIFNNIKFKFINSTGILYKDISIFLNILFNSLNTLYKYKSFLNYIKKNNSFYVNKELIKLVKYDFNLFNNNNITINKNFLFFSNLKIANFRKKYFYKKAYENLNKNNNLLNKFINLNIRFITYLLNYGEEFSSEIYINTISYNVKNPKISIIMPIYNSENFIEESLNSLLNQTFKNYEIICVNDGSTDNTMKILKKFEKKNDRIHIISQNNNGAGTARNVGMKLSKGEYLIFLDSDDIFEYTMLEELYAKIKGTKVDVVICNSKNFKNKKLYSYKNYKIKENFKNKIFSSTDVKKEFFSLFIWWPWDKIFNKKYIENLGIKYQNLKSTNDLFFIASSVIISKNIYFIDKVFIYHRVGVKTSIENSREKSWDNFYYALKELKKFIKEKGLYKRFKQDFINYVARFSIWNIETIFGESYCFLYQKLKNEWWNEFGVSKHYEKFFYRKNIYKKVKYILETELEQIENINEIDKNLFVLNQKKFACIPKVSVIISIYNSQKYLSKSLNSIINQTLKEIEIICINDGSTDNSLKILNYYKKKDNRIIIFNQKNKGVNEARNLGLKYSKGQYILFLDSDDILVPYALEKLFNISKNNNLEILYFNAKFILENDNQIQLNLDCKSNNIIEKEKFLIFNILKENKRLFYCNFQIFNRLFLLKNKIKFLSGIKYNDILFSFKLILKLNRTLELNETFYIKTFHKKSIKKTDKLIRILNDYIICIKELFIESLKHENKNLIVFKFLELYINNIEEIIFFILNKIEINKIFLINNFSKNDKYLLLLILIFNNIENNLIENIYNKKNQNFDFYIFLLSRTEKKFCINLKYKIINLKKYYLKNE